MPRYRHALPQLNGGHFLTDGGIETYLIFKKGYDLPYGEAFKLLESEEGLEEINRWFDDFFAIARDFGAGFILESTTWRASADWAARVGTPPDLLETLNRKAIEVLVDLRERHQEVVSQIVVSGNIGPRADAYRPEEIMTEEEAERYHSMQISVFAETEADLATAVTLTNIPEAIGIVRASQKAGVPSVLSFTVETDGCLPTGPTLKEAIERVDEATGGGPAYYMINCAHPTHYAHALVPGESWTDRIRGMRANGSCKTHAELDESTELDEGDPVDLAQRYLDIRTDFPRINILGGCCGTDHRHIWEIARACLTV